MSPPSGRVKAATCQTRCLKLLLHFLGFFLDFLAASLDVLACALDRVARGQRNRSKCRKAKYEFLEHGISLNLSNWGDSIHPKKTGASRMPVLTASVRATARTAYHRRRRRGPL